MKTKLQQGDVLLRKLDGMPEGKYKVLQRKRVVVAEGEKTGHCHVIEDKDAELIQMGDKILLSLKNSAVIEHQEHGPITVEPGVWETGIVREHDYYSQMVRPVAD
jgi:hypothetical protein